MDEEWKTIQRYPNYMVSNAGRVYSNRRGRMLKMAPDTKGYPQVNLEQDGFWVQRSVHSLVAFEFVDGYFDGAQVNHKDGVKTNNFYWNLEWMTAGDNIRHSLSTGLRQKRSVLILETGVVFVSVNDCAKYFGVKPRTIYGCLSDRLRNLQGFHFRYADERRVERG